MKKNRHNIVSIFKKTVVVLLALWFNIFTPAFADDWALKKDKNNLLIYTKLNPNSAFNLLKVECDVNASASEMLSLIFDVSSHKKWVYNCLQSRLVKKINDLNIYYYGETYAPWPVTNRDLVLHLTATQDSATKVVTVKAVSVPQMLPEVEGLVRVTQSESIWILTPITNGKLRINYTLDIAPGGSLPAWLVNFASVEGPYESFLKIKEVLQSGKYNHRTFDQIID